MKCEKCGMNEANFFYRESINGQRREMHLCSECAGTEGLVSRAERRGGDLFGSDIFDLFFSSFGLPGMGGFLRPVMAAPLKAPKRAAQEGESRAEQHSAVDEALKKRREQNMLRLQLRDAVAREDYESAITLRDQLRAMEEPGPDQGSAEA